MLHQLHLAVHFDADIEGSRRQAIVAIVALFVGLDRVTALAIEAIDLDSDTLQRLTIGAYHRALDARRLGKCGKRKQN
jgi:hypothetical protein